MRRIDRIRSMSVTEMADALMETEMVDEIEFCQNKKNCMEKNDSGEGVLPETCKGCLVKWLMEEG